MSLLAALVAVAATAPFVSDDPDSIVTAIEHDRGLVTSASYVARPDGSVTAIGSGPNANTQPLDGWSVGYLSNGDATAGWTGTQADNVSHERGTTFRGGHDVVVLSMRVSVPAEANCLTLGASFFSEDYGESVTDDPRYFDGFLAELDPAAPWAAGTGQPDTLDATANFAKVQMPGGPTPVSAEVQSGTYSAQQAFGTSYDGTTQWHTYKVPVTPGPHVLQLSIFDRADSTYDSTVLLDDLRAIRRRPETCTFPARDQFSTAEDLDAPAVTIEAADGRLSGRAATGPDDAAMLTVQVGPERYGVPVRGDGTWALAPSGMSGTYSARATQTDSAGNEGRSPAVDVTLTSAPPPSPEPTASPTSAPTAGPTPSPTAVPTAAPAPARPAPQAGGTSPPPPAPGPAGPFGAPPPPLRPPPARCRVPKLRGKRLKTAARALRRAHCRLGRISRKRARKGRSGRVLTQTPKAGARRPAGTRVKLTLRR